MLFDGGQGVNFWSLNGLDQATAHTNFTDYTLRAQSVSQYRNYISNVDYGNRADVLLPSAGKWTLLAHSNQRDAHRLLDLGGEKPRFRQVPIPNGFGRTTTDFEFSPDAKRL